MFVMKILNTLLFVLFALSANAADGTVGTVSVQKGNNVSVNGESPLSLTLDGKDHQSCQFLSKRAPDESHEFTWKEVTTTRGGELAELLGDQLRSIDSLVVKGNVNDDDFHTMWDASLHGNLSVINLENAVVENNAIPDNAFYHANEQYEGDSNERLLHRSKKDYPSRGFGEDRQISLFPGLCPQASELPVLSSLFGRVCV